MYRDISGLDIGVHVLNQKLNNWDWVVVSVVPVLNKDMVIGYLGTGT